LGRCPDESAPQPGSDDGYRDISSDVALKNPERSDFLDPDGIPTEALPITHFLDAALDYCDSTLLPRFADEFK
jgi:hypothetical protein